MKKRPKTKSSDPTASLLKTLLGKTVTIDGQVISTREALIRMLYRDSLDGDINASIDLQKRRDDCGLKEEAPRVGCLLLPEPLSEEDWERMAAEQQAPFREKNYGKDGF
jgi:hypothetical protein